MIGVNVGVPVPREPLVLWLNDSKFACKWYYWKVQSRVLDQIKSTNGMLKQV
jgi:hypothetical protein